MNRIRTAARTADARTGPGNVFVVEDEREAFCDLLLFNTVDFAIYENDWPLCYLKFRSAGSVWLCSLYLKPQS